MQSHEGLKYLTSPSKSKWDFWYFAQCLIHKFYSVELNTLSSSVVYHLIYSFSLSFSMQPCCAIWSFVPMLWCLGLHTCMHLLFETKDTITGFACRVPYVCFTKWSSTAFLLLTPREIVQPFSDAVCDTVIKSSNHKRQAAHANIFLMIEQNNTLKYKWVECCDWHLNHLKHYRQYSLLLFVCWLINGAVIPWLGKPSLPLYVTFFFILFSLSFFWSIII